MINKKKALIEGLEEMLRDPYRPAYHFAHPYGIALPGDPNGIIWWKGRCHMFYIFQDEEERHCWGHASTVDYVHWRLHPTALRPDSPLSGERIYSGNAFISLEGIPTISYYGYNLGVCLATSKDDLLENWELCPNNPVLPMPREGAPDYNEYNIYDSHIWIENKIYYMLVAGSKHKATPPYDTAHLYTSKDLLHWCYVKEFYRPLPHWTHPNEDCACNDFFPLDDQYVLLCISHMYGARAYIGDYHNNIFSPHTHVRLNSPGGCIFAPETVLDPSGRRIMFAWAIDSNLYENETTRFSSCMTLPLVLKINKSKNLVVYPAEEILSLCRNKETLKSIVLTSEDTELELPQSFNGRVKRLRVTMKRLLSGKSGIKILCSPDGSEETSIYADWTEEAVYIDFTKSRSDPSFVYKDTIIELNMPCGKNILRQSCALPQELHNNIMLDIFIDKSIVEVFIDDKISMAQRIYPMQADSVYTKLFGSLGSEYLRIESWDIDYGMSF